MFSQNEFLCPFEALKRDDVSEINKFLNISAASQDTFQRNNTKKTYQAFDRFHQFSLKRIYSVRSYSFLHKMD